MIWDPIARVRNWRHRRPPDDLRWPSIDDPLWPEPMPIEERVAPQRAHVADLWDLHEWQRVWPRRITLIALPLAALSIWGLISLGDTPSVCLGIIAFFSVAVLPHAATAWWQWDSRDWAQKIEMWPYERVQRWRDHTQWQERPWWWPRAIWWSMRPKAYRIAQYVLLSPIAITLAIVVLAGMALLLAFLVAGIPVVVAVLKTMVHHAGA